MIRNLIKAAVSAGKAAPRTGAGMIGSGVFTGLVGLGLYMEMMGPGKEYGMGVGIARGLAYATFAPGMALMAYDIGKGLGDSAYTTQQARGKSSFTQGQPDLLGTRATMRQRSQQSLGRGRASLGSEARLFH